MMTFTWADRITAATVKSVSHHVDELMTLPDIDGALVGGLFLKVASPASCISRREERGGWGY